MPDNSPETFESLIAFLSDQNRLVPQSVAWNGLYQKLKTSGDEKRPPLPLILGAWWNTVHLQKIARFREHLRWAETQGQLDEIGAYLRGLQDDEWFSPQES